MKTRLNNIVLLIACLLFFLLRGNANKKPDKIHNIFINPAGKLGDVVCTTPVFRAIRKHMPDTKIFVEDISGFNTQLLNDSSLVDGYLKLRNVQSAINEIKDRRVDVVLLTGPSFQMLAYAYLAGVPFIVAPIVKGGHCPQQTRSYLMLSKFAVNASFAFNGYAPLERLRILEPFGIIFDDTKKELGFSDKAIQRVDMFFIENNIKPKEDFLVGVTLSAGNKIKMWGVEKFAEVINHLNKKHNAKIIIIGSAKDRYLSEDIESFIIDKSCIIDTSGVFSIDELKAFISRLDLFIGVDTGPIYIAEAFDIPTIDIVGPMDEMGQPPNGGKHRIVKVDRKEPALRIMNARVYDKKEAERQNREITARMVIHEVEMLIKEIGK